jgi:hypothetical protein
MEKLHAVLLCFIAASCQLDVLIQSIRDGTSARGIRLLYTLHIFGRSSTCS